MARRTMRTTEWVLGTDLSTRLREQALDKYIYRQVGPGKMFATDAEWLANTRFAVIDYGYTHARFNRLIANALAVWDAACMTLHSQRLEPLNTGE